MDIYQSIADRRIAAAREAGLFDDLPGAGEPLPDLDRERPPGWWAARLVKREKSMLAAEELDREVRLAKPGLWRSTSETEVRMRLAELNERIDAYNRTTTWEPRSRIDEADAIDRWRGLRFHR